MVIYNHNGEAKIVTLPNKPINYILVLVMDGDEVTTVFFNDLSNIYVDEAPERKVGQFNTSYIVSKDAIDAWMNYKPKSSENAAFERKRFVESMEKGELNGRAD